MQKLDRKPLSWRQIMRKLLLDTSGNVLPIGAVGLIVVTAMVGGGIDMSRAYKVERRLQSACDAGALAGRRAVGTNGFDSTAEGQADSYFNTNFSEAQQEASQTTFVASSPDDGNTVVGTASTKLDTAVMKIFGFNDFDIDVSCSASMGVGNSDITMVLDNTGSMADEPDGTSPEAGELSKIQSLRQAMKDFYDTVATSTAGSNARVRYAFVPYSTTVRVGQLLDPDYIVDSVAIQSRQLVNWGPVVATWSGGSSTSNPTNGSWSLHSSTKYSSTGTCNSAKPADTAWAAFGSPVIASGTPSVDSTTGQQLTAVTSTQEYRYTDYECRNAGGGKWQINKRTVSQNTSSSTVEARNQVNVTTNNTAYSDIVYQQRTFDVSSYKTFTPVTIPFGTSSGRSSNRTYTWTGCIQERTTTPASSFSFVSLEDGITPSEALDLDIDSAPTDEASRWRPLWPEVAYYRASSNPAFSTSGTLASSPCPYESRLFDEYIEADFDNYADQLVATGNTYHDIGLIWGARISSTTGIFADNVNDEPSNGGTVSRHMIFMTDGELFPQEEINSSYGIERHDRRVTTNGSESAQFDRHRSRFLAVCEAIKARGIRLWVIAFGTSLSADLSTCGSTDSSFQADNDAQLQAHFQEIATQVGELRVIQ